jgi:MFS family permease
MFFVLKALFGTRLPVVRRLAARHSLLPDSLRNFLHGIAFFRTERLMRGLLVYAMIQSSLLALAALMITPLVLASHDSEQLGLIYACGAVGGLAGALLMIALRNPRRLMVIIVCADSLLSVCVLCSGIADSMSGYCLLAFLAMAAAGVAEGCSNALWMRKIPTENRGSVFALISMLCLMTLSAVMMGGGFCIDRVLGPSLAPGGFLALHIGGWFDTGKRGPVALLFVASGALGLLICVSTLVNRRLRQLDLLVLDSIDGSERNDATRAGAFG